MSDSNGNNSVSATANGSAAGDTDRFSENSRPHHVQQIYARLPFPVLSGSANIEYWFRQLESWFSLQGIVDEKVRFETVVASLTPALFDQAVEVINNPPAANAYSKLKGTIIDRFADSEYTRVNNLLSSVPLGAQRPSHLLADIRRFGATQDERLLRICWLRRLPANIRAVVSVMKVSLSEQAEMADSVYDSLQSENASQIAVTSATFTPSQANSNTIQTANGSTNDFQLQMLRQMEQLALTVAELKSERQSRTSQVTDQRSSSRVRSKSRGDSQQSSTCWYHRNFGVAAQKCVDPCNFLAPTAPTMSHR